MSEESKPDEPRIPDELAAFEAELAARALPAPRIDRDQLMYRAGWAACEAQCQPRPLAGGRFEARPRPAAVETYPPAEPGGIRERRRTLSWSLASAALAASIAVMATLGWQRVASRVDEAGGSGGEPPRFASEEGLPQTIAEVKRLTSRDVSAAEIDRLLNASGRDDRLSLAGPWFAMKQRGLGEMASDDNVRADEAAATDLEPPTAKTARELWKELNPNKSTTPTPVWPWRQPLTGDSI
jgi:hypothetical protein